MGDTPAVVEAQEGQGSEFAAAMRKQAGLPDSPTQGEVGAFAPVMETPGDLLLDGYGFRIPLAEGGTAHPDLVKADDLRRAALDAAKAAQSKATEVAGDRHLREEGKAERLAEIRKKADAAIEDRLLGVDAARIHKAAEQWRENLKGRLLARLSEPPAKGEATQAALLQVAARGDRERNALIEMAATDSAANAVLARFGAVIGASREAIASARVRYAEANMASDLAAARAAISGSEALAAAKVALDGRATDPRKAGARSGERALQAAYQPRSNFRLGDLLTD